MKAVTLFTAEPLQLVFMVSPPDERAPTMFVLTTFAEGRRLARRTATLEEGGEVSVIGRLPRQLMYVATEDDPGLQAGIYALVADSSEEWKGTNAEEFEAVFLGIVVRAQECRVHPGDLAAEAADHFAAILGGRTVEPLEQLLKRLA